MVDFINQIKRNENILITDWRMTRFIMSLDESVNLVLHAMLNGTHGDLFVQKAPSANLRTILSSVENLLGEKSNKIIENYNNKIIDIDTKLDDLYQLSMESKTKCYYCENDYNNKSNLIFINNLNHINKINNISTYIICVGTPLNKKKIPIFLITYNLTNKIVILIKISVIM
jgi:UDP-glucose 4-epimerase